MPQGKAKFLDLWSEVTIAITLALFMGALFLKGLTHDLLLEAGVFLISAKLVIMAYKSHVLGERLEARLEEIQEALRRRDDPHHK